MALNVGSAYADFDLSLGGLRRSIAEAKRLLTDLRNEAAKPLPTPRAAAANTQAPNAASLAQQRVATAQQRTALTANQAAVAAQRLATEQNKTAREAANAAAAQDRAAKSALQLASAQDRAAKASKNNGLGPALPRTFAGVTSAGVNQLAGAAFAGLGVSAVIGAGSEALALRETKNGLLAVSGSAETYAKTLRIAREQQELFGGTLRENIDGLTGLTITARQSGAQLESLVDLSQRLAVLDPSQGAAGARIALSEALSGDPTSLAKRYEIPRAALAKLRDESISAGDKLLILDAYLNKVGISSAAVAGRIDQDALAFRKAKAEIEEATIRLGEYITKVGAVPARGLTELLDAGQITAGAKTEGDQTQGNLIAQAQGFQAYAASVRDANDQVRASFAGDPIAGALALRFHGLQQLNPVQFAYAQSLIQTGVASDVALAKANALGAVSDALTQQTQGTDSAFQALIPKMAAVSAQSTDQASQVLALNSAYLQGQVSIQQVTGVLDALIGVQGLAITRAQDEARENLRLARSFDAIVPAANAAQVAINALAGAKPKTRNIEDRSGNISGIAGVLGKGTGIDTVSINKAYEEQLAAARLQFQLTTAKDNKAKIAILRQELAKATSELDKLNIQNQIAGLQGGGSGGGSSAGSAGGRGLSTLAKTDIQLAGDHQAQLDAVNRRLSSGNLTQLQRNQLLIQQRDLQKEINQESRKQLEDQLSLQESLINDRKAQRDEQKQLKLFGRVAARGGERGAAAQDEIALLEIARQRRQLAIQGLQEAVGTAVTPAGGIVPANVLSPVTGPLTASSGATPAQAAGGSGLTVNLNINGKTIATEIVPDILAALRGSIAGARNAGT